MQKDLPNNDLHGEKKSISRRKFVGIGLTGIAVAGILTFLKKCTNILGIHNNIGDFVNCAFRLTDQNSLLNLEYYFINCDYHPSSSKIWAKYAPHENYMIVRLPQQHIAEQSFSEKNIIGNSITDFKAATYISGYSYLVFRILFPNDGFFRSMITDDNGEHTYINLTKQDLLKWDDEKKFRLVVRQDLTESLFELFQPKYYNNDAISHAHIDSLKLEQNKSSADSSELDSILRPRIENRFPFQQKDSDDSLKIDIDTSKYDINRLPKVYGDPVTAIELPWRLIISPKLPDSSRFKFKWEFPETDLGKIKAKDKGKFQLWTAVLTIAERTDSEYIKRKENQQANDNEAAKNASTNSLNDIINQLELMILGSPDYPNVKFNPKNLNGDITLPTGAHRTDLVALYIKLKILARTEKLTLSAIGATTKIHLKNEKIEEALKLKPSIAVIEWNQVISLGRDEKVEVSTLFLEAEFGHKMAYIVIAERKLKGGSYPLIKKEFIVPLDITKDYTNHITQMTDQKDKDGNSLIISRFNAPFKKITFLETKPKELINKPFDQNTLNQTGTIFQFEAIDWHGNTIRFAKEINGITFNYALSSITGIDTAATNSLKKNVFGNEDIYNKNSLNTIPDTSKFIFKDLNTIASDAENNTEAKIKVLDDKIKEIKDSTTGFARSLDAIYLSDANNLPTSIKIDEYLNQIENYYESFFQYIKNFIATLYSRSNVTLEQIQSKIDLIKLETVKGFLVEHYFFIDQNNFALLYALYKKNLSVNTSDILLKQIAKEKFKTKGDLTTFNQHLQSIFLKTINIDKLKDGDITAEDFEKLWLTIRDTFKADFQKWLMDDIGFLKQTAKEKFKTKDDLNKFNQYLISIFVDTINIDKLKDGDVTNEDFENLWLQINNTFKIYFQKWIVIKELQDFSKVNIDENSIGASAYFFLKQIETDFPEISKVFINLQLLFEKDGAKIQGLIDNIKQRLKLFYDLEQKAKEIPGLILLQKQKIGYAIKEKYDEVRQDLINNLSDNTGQVKKSLSELESEYIIFKGGLRQTENNAFDFFHDYAIIPQVQQAKVYVSALNKLVNEDLPISINYARDYLENQVRDAEFEVKQNAAMVFGEVQQFSREQVKGLIQKIGDKMPGFNIEIPAHYLTYARNPNTEAVEQSLKNLTRDLGEQFNSQYGDTLKNYSRDLIFISEDVKKAVKVIDDLRNVDPKKYFKDLGAKLFGSIALEDILDIGFDVPRITELPDKLIYQVSTDKFKNFQAAFVVFKPNAKPDNPTRLELFVSKSLKNVHEYYSYTQLNNFSVGVVIGGTEVLTITFEQFKITSSTNQPKKTDVSITDVKLGGPLEFIADLAKKFMAPGNGMRIKPGPRNLTVDYTIALPDIKAPAFNFRNLQLVIGVNIPYDPSTLKAISFTFGVNKPEDKFLVSAGTYGGRGHFQLTATPKGIQRIDVAIELGAYASIDLGIGKGEVFLFFGFWFITGKDDNNENYIKAVAYVICAGSATVLGFITIGVSVLIALTYIKRGNASLFYGEAVVTYSVKIAFFKKEFSIRYYKEIAGSSKGNNTQSLQTGAIFLDTNLPGGVDVSNDTDARNFEDVFKDEEALEEYLLCFA